MTRAHDEDGVDRLGRPSPTLVGGLPRGELLPPGQPAKRRIALPSRLSPQRGVSGSCRRRPSCGRHRVPNGHSLGAIPTSPGSYRLSLCPSLVGRSLPGNTLRGYPVRAPHARETGDGRLLHLKPLVQRGVRSVVTEPRASPRPPGRSLPGGQSPGPRQGAASVEARGHDLGGAAVDGHHAGSSGQGISASVRPSILLPAPTV